ncbi:Rapid ALkalinization Factor [Corchorus capsularis]|uniref:Rapid ALkalinization Factor n=1 Tax=Corchorus capsularis TaxID=210143 RepID=A0A1R3IV79_COCAP|nr:Rapid ALkalinization Factor [Corchorus capsularis]
MATTSIIIVKAFFFVLLTLSMAMSAGGFKAKSLGYYTFAKPNPPCQAADPKNCPQKPANPYTRPCNDPNLCRNHN